MIASRTIAVGFVIVVALASIVALSWPPGTAPLAPAPIRPDLPGVSAPDEVGRQTAGDEVVDDLSASAQRETVPVVETPVDPERSRVVGVVVDENGEPISAVDVRLSVRLFPVYRKHHAAATDASGAFCFDGIVAGTATLDLAADGVCGAQIGLGKLERGEVRDLGEVALYRGTEVDGLVRLDGKVAPGVQLFIVRGVEDRAAPDGAAVFTDGDGRFRVPQRLSPGRYRVLATPAVRIGPPIVTGRRGKLIATEFELSAGQEHFTVQIDLVGDGG